MNDTDSYFCRMPPIMLGIGQALPIAITMLILRISTTFLCPHDASRAAWHGHGGCDDQETLPATAPKKDNP